MILAALVAPVVGPLTVWRVTRRTSRNETETNAEPAADTGDGPTLSSRVRYHLVLTRFKLRLLALRVRGGFVDWVSR